CNEPTHQGIPKVGVGAFVGCAFGHPKLIIGTPGIQVHSLRQKPQGTHYPPFDGPDHLPLANDLEQLVTPGFGQPLFLQNLGDMSQQVIDACGRLVGPGNVDRFVGDHDPGKFSQAVDSLGADPATKTTTDRYVTT